MAAEAAWLNGNNLEKEETKKKKRKNERIDLTLTGLLIEELTMPTCGKVRACIHVRMEYGWSIGRHVDN